METDLIVIPYSVIGHNFHFSFRSIFDPTSLLSLLIPLSPSLMSIFLMPHHAHDKEDRAMIQLVKVHRTTYS